MKATLRDTSFPAGTVKGNGVSRTANCELLPETEEMVTLPPLALSSTVCFAVVPTATFAKVERGGGNGQFRLTRADAGAGKCYVQVRTEDEGIAATGPTACGSK